MEGVMATIMMFAGNFAPKNWAFCNGQLVSIASNTALFSLIGTYYGGDGRTTFALPNFQGRVPTHWGHGPGLSPYSLAQMGGSETTTLIASNLPPAPVTIMASTLAPNSDEPSGAVMAATGSNLYQTSNPNTQMRAGLLAGNSVPVNNIQPYLAVTFVICQYGIFPSRN